MTRIFQAPPDPGHALLDSGAGRKLERFGTFVLDRPDPQALWRPRLAPAEWERRRHLYFVRESDRGGRWERTARDVPDRWTVTHSGAPCIVRPTKFKHVGLFPEQAANWRWIGERAAELRGLGEDPEPRLLNLFGYTGVASVFAARAGFRVTHVDASKTSLAWARENAALSALPDGALRIVLDDALAFARREVRRKSTYAAIVLDPPHYGRGPKGEKWQLEEGLTALMDACSELLAPHAVLVLSTYAVGLSPLTLRGVLSDLPAGQSLEGELALSEESVDGGPTRLLPCGFCARWWRGVAGD